MFGAGIVGSGNKQAGWNRYVSSLDSLISNPRPTAEELKSIHALMTSYEVTELLSDPDMREVLEFDLYTLDRPDGEEKSDRLFGIYNLMRHEIDHMHPYKAFRTLKEMHTKICKDDTEIRLDVVVPGELRRLGERRIRDGDWTTVYHAHTNIYDEGVLPRSFYGLSIGLREAYEALCATYDEMMERGRNGKFNDRLMAEGFLQTLGTRVLHPFWDGNGRAFAGHIALMLEREGLRAREKASIDQMIAPLTNITETILAHILIKAGLPFISGEDHFKINFDHQFRKDYMKRLLGAITYYMQNWNNEDAQPIEDPGTGMPIRPVDFYSNSAWQIRRALLKNGLIESSIGDARRMALEDEQLQRLSPDERHKFAVLIPYAYANEFD